MKKTALFITALLLSTFSIIANSNPQSLSNQYSEIVAIEKEFLIEYYEQTFSNLEHQIEGLSEEQLHFSPSDEAWNILQVLEHIFIVERSLFESAMELMAQSESSEDREEIQMTDNEIIERMENRDQKAQAPEAIHPTGEYSNPGEIMEELKNLRQEILHMLEETPEEYLRSRIGDSPMGVVDAYQYFLIIAAHTARHTNQIEDIKASREFPRE